jgi:hypothetical protein
MYDSNRHGYITFGWVATILLALFAGAVYHSQYTRIEQSAGSANKCAEQNQAAAAPSANVASPTGDQETSDGDEPDKRQPDWCDLAAQQSMAESTRGMHWAAWATVAFTGFGAFLIWRTLLATQDTVIETRRIGERQVRAYVGVTDISIERTDTDSPTVKLKIKNGGQSPAYKIAIRTGYVVNFKGSPQHADQNREQVERGFDIGPGQEIHHPVYVAELIWAVAQSTIRNKAGRFFIFGRIDYEDAFEVARETLFRFEFYETEDGIKDGEHFSITAEGNRST